MGGFRLAPNGNDPLGLGLVVSFPMFQSGGGQAVGAANRAHFYKLISGGPVSQIAVQIGVQSGNVDVGIYAPSGSGAGAFPAVRRGSAGGVACPAPGDQVIALSSPIVAVKGDFIAVSADNNVATFANAGLFQQAAMEAGLSWMHPAGYPLPASIASPAALFLGSFRGFMLVGLP